MITIFFYLCIEKSWIISLIKVKGRYNIIIRVGQISIKYNDFKINQDSLLLI